MDIQECIERIHQNKVIPYNTYNLLKDIEYNEEIIIQEICKNLNDISK